MSFSWEKPIEQEILEYVQAMAKHMENVVTSGQKEVRERASNYAKAYRMVEKHILEEIEIRKTLKRRKNEKNN